jgi:hypothetical protein
LEPFPIGLFLETPQTIFRKQSLQFLVDRDKAAVDATSVITVGLIVADARFPFFCAYLSLLDYVCA